MRKILISMVAMLLMTAMQLNAQSVNYAKLLIEQGRYLEAAKELRPMADNGDDKAQYLAATLFFEGKGINKNDEQGVKYATLSANQGNADAIKLLADYYYNSNQLDKMFPLFNSITSSHPYLLKEIAGVKLSECYMHGWGVEKDEDKAWEIARENKHFKQMKASYPDQWQAFKDRHPEEYAPVLYKNISIQSGPSNVKILEIYFGDEAATIKFRYTNPFHVAHSIVGLETDLIANGKRYRMLHCSLGRRTLRPGESAEYFASFEYIPHNIKTFDLEVGSNYKLLGITFK